MISWLSGATVLLVALELCDNSDYAVREIGSQLLRCHSEAMLHQASKLRLNAEQRRRVNCAIIALHTRRSQWCIDELNCPWVDSFAGLSWQGVQFWLAVARENMREEMQYSWQDYRIASRYMLIWSAWQGAGFVLSDVVIMQAVANDMAWRVKHNYWGD